MMMFVGFSRYLLGLCTAEQHLLILAFYKVIVMNWQQGLEHMMRRTSNLILRSKNRKISKSKLKSVV